MNGWITGKNMWNWRRIYHLLSYTLFLHAKWPAAFLISFLFVFQKHQSNRQPSIIFPLFPSWMLNNTFASRSGLPFSIPTGWSLAFFAYLFTTPLPLRRPPRYPLSLANHLNSMLYILYSIVIGPSLCMFFSCLILDDYFFNFLINPPHVHFCCSCVFFCLLFEVRCQVIAIHRVFYLLPAVAHFIPPGVRRNPFTPHSQRDFPGWVLSVSLAWFCPNRSSRKN